MAQSFRAFLSPDPSRNLICVWVHDSSAGNTVFVPAKVLHKDNMLCHTWKYEKGKEYLESPQPILYQWGWP